MKISGATALVTGANRGLGLAFARALLAGGVEPGETVVSYGAQLLYPGRVVKPVEDTE